MEDNIIIAKRICECRKLLGMTQEELGKRLGLNKSTIQRYENAKIDKIKKPVIVEMANILGVSYEYLSGKTDNPDVKKQDLSALGLSPAIVKKFPMLKKISAGKPVMSEDGYEAFIEASGTIDADFCFVAKGDSMINARIFDGDVVFIKEQEFVNDGEIAAVLVGDEVELKRFYYNEDEKKVILQPENPLHKAKIYVDGELQKIQILGRAVAFMSLVR